MNGRILLDTSVVVEFLRGNTAVAARLAQAERIYTFGVVLGELYFGALISAKIEENTHQIDVFGSQTSFLACDLDTA